MQVLGGNLFAHDIATFHYSPGLRVGGLVHISGQIGINEDRSVVGGREEQARAAFSLIGRLLEECDLDFSSVVALTTYHVGGVDELDEWFTPVKDQFVTASPYPTWTAIGIESLAVPEALVGSAPSPSRLRRDRRQAATSPACPITRSAPLLCSTFWLSARQLARRFSNDEFW